MQVGVGAGWVDLGRRWVWQLSGVSVVGGGFSKLGGRLLPPFSFRARCGAAVRGGCWCMHAPAPANAPSCHPPPTLQSPCTACPLPAERDLGDFTDSFTTAVSVRDVAALRITPLDGPRDDGWRPWHSQPMYEAQDANLAVQLKSDWVGAGAPWVDLEINSAEPVYQVSSSKQGGKGGKAGRRLTSARASAA